MRVLCTCKGGSDGHLDPLLPIARALRERGDDVRFASDPSRGDRLAAEGFALEAAGLDIREQIARAKPLVAAAGGTLGEGDLTYATLFPTVAAPPMLHDLAAIGARWRPDLVVHEIAEFAGPPFAASLGVPWLTVGLGLPVAPALAERAGRSAEVLWHQLGLDPPPLGGLYRHAFLDPSPRSLAPRWDLGEASTRISYRTGAPELPAPALAVDIDAHLTRHAGLPVVQVTLGTAGFNRRTDVFSTVIAALAAREVVGVVTVGATNDPAALGPVPDRVLVVRYAPIAALLPRCDVVVSHAGAGTTFATLGHGLPSVLLPLGADQPHIAAAVAAAGAARVLSPDDLQVVTVADALDWALHDHRVQQAAEALASEIATTASPEAAVTSALSRIGTS